MVETEINQTEADKAEVDRIMAESSDEDDKVEAVDLSTFDFELNGPDCAHIKDEIMEYLDDRKCNPFE